MGYSPTEYAEFTEPPAEMSSHGFHRFTQILRVRCSPTEFTEFGSVGMAGMPYPPISVNIRANLWKALLCQKFLCVPCVLWEYLFSHGFHRFTQILRVRCSPTEFTEFGSVGMAGMPYPPISVNIRANLWKALLCQKFLCVPCVLWEYLFSHGFHRFTQILMVRCSPTEFTEYTEFGSVGMQQGCHTLLHLCASVSSVGVLSLPEVLCIRCIPWELLHRLFGWCSRDSCTPWRNPRK